ncbi:alcohol dehydrogenase-like protein [Amycolatopsis sulphurea]|uniref:Alcohol dehydrogenase-like protein n=1 Tax=Amycolatopsis sulphurea TaxID=76022 RepID=A0A2A9FFA7_9PSEU|nr:alcohol dehydrogenase-like protein [Amycolatopsis sulphurea]
MKAVRFSRFGGPEVLEIVELPDPHPEPGQIRIAVRAPGVNLSDWKKRKGLMLPQTMGHEAAVVDELGEGVHDVVVGDRVFGFSADGTARAELAVLACYAPIPPSLGFPTAASLPAPIETAVRALDQLGVTAGSTVLINGASGSIGSPGLDLLPVRAVKGPFTDSESGKGPFTDLIRGGPAVGLRPCTPTRSTRSANWSSPDASHPRQRRPSPSLKSPKRTASAKKAAYARSSSW